MRRIIGKMMAAGLALSLCLGSFAGYAADFTVTTDESDFAASDIELETSRLLPLRSTAENYGFTVTWNEDERIVLEKGGLKIRLQIGSDDIFVNDEAVDLHYTPHLIGDKTYLTHGFYSSFFTDWYITQTATLAEGSTYMITEKTPISAENMMNTVREISQIPRHTTDETHKDAVQYVTNKFEEYGYTVTQQPFEYRCVNWDTEQFENGAGVNLVAVKEADLNPTGDVLIIGAHYDGVAGMPAANDNGSGVSVLLELARVLRHLPSDTEIRFVAFDAEEDGLCGSSAYVRQLTDAQNIIGMINFDMLGGAKAGEVKIYTADEQENFLIDILRQSYEFCGVELGSNLNGTSDHMSFPARLIQAIDFTNETIHDEYHNENDLAEHISADMLEYAAKGGEAVATAIMSNLTPLSYRGIAKPQDNDDVFEITPQTYIPTYGTVDKIHRETGAAPVQIESDDENMKYRVHIKLFGLDVPLDMIYSGYSGTMISPSVNLTDSGLSYESVKALLDEKIGGGEKIQGDEYGYLYNSVYGNRFNLYYNPEDSERRLFINIGDCYDNDKEAYALKNGELIGMDSAELETVYQITKTKDGVSVTQNAPKPSRNSEVSEKARKCWEKIKPLMTEEEIEGISYLVLESDGFGKQKISLMDYTEHSAVGVSIEGTDGVEIPEEYKTLPQNIQQTIKSMLTRDAGEGVSMTLSENMPGVRLTVDYNDLLDERGAAYSDEDLLRAYAAMKGQDLFSAKNFRNPDAVYPKDGTPFEKNTYNLKRDSTMYAFADRFYRDIYGDEKYYTRDLFGEYPNEFVCEDAAYSIDDDMAYSFAEFVAGDKPEGDSVTEQKIKFFYDYPEYVKIREQLRSRI